MQILLQTENAITVDRDMGQTRKINCISACLWYLMEAFELISPISESSNCVDIKRVLSLTNSSDSLLQPSQMYFLVSFSAVVQKTKISENIKKQQSVYHFQLHSPILFDKSLLTSQSFLLVPCLFLSIELVERSRTTVRKKRWKLLRLQLLLNAMKLTPTGRH